MFRVEHNVPDVYPQESRDFQLFSRLYDLVFQSARFSIDSLEQVSDTLSCNDKLLPLLATKVGFFTDLNLTTMNDRIVLSAFPHIIRYKGSLQGIKYVANVFQHIMNVRVDVDTTELTDNRIVLRFKDYTPNVTLLYSLLEYVRPTGLLIDYIVASAAPSSTGSYQVRLTNRNTPMYVTKLDSTETGDTNINSTQSGVITRSYADGDMERVACNVGYTQISRVGEINKEEHSDEQ